MGPALFLILSQHFERADVCSDNEISRIRDQLLEVFSYCRWPACLVQPVTYRPMRMNKAGSGSSAIFGYAWNRTGIRCKAMASNATIACVFGSGCAAGSRPESTTTGLRWLRPEVDRICHSNHRISRSSIMTMAPQVPTSSIWIAGIWTTTEAVSKPGSAVTNCRSGTRTNFLCSTT